MIDVTTIGNAIVDIIAQCSDSYLIEQNIIKSSMNLIDEERSKSLYENLEKPKIISGGSAANTSVGISSLGSNTAFIGKVKNDELGQTFKNDIIVEFDTQKLTSQNFQILVNLSELLQDSGEIGEMEYDIFKFHIKSLESYENNLIVCER